MTNIERNENGHLFIFFGDQKKARCNQCDGFQEVVRGKPCKNASSARNQPVTEEAKTPDSTMVEGKKINAEDAAFIELVRDMRKTQLDIEALGVPALKRIMNFAEGSDTGGASVLAKILLGCYNGAHYPFDISELRRLDSQFLDDVLAVLRMDARARIEVHRHFENGGERFAALSAKFNLRG